MTKKKSKIAIQTTSGKRLVAEINPNTEFKELYIYLEDEDGIFLQDLVCVGEDFRVDVDGAGQPAVVPIPKQYAVHVWGNEEGEDWTERFEVKEYQEPDEPDE